MLNDDDEVTVQILGTGDAAILDQVDDDVFDNPVRPELVRAFLHDPGNLIAVARHQGVVVGMATGLAYLHPDKPLQLFVNEVGVSGKFHRRGIGKKLVMALLERGRELGCVEAWVATEEENLPARALYASLGGKEDASRAVVYTYQL